MLFSTLLNVISHIAFIPMIIHNARSGRWHSVIIDLMSVGAASPAYHLCYGGTWCLWPLRTMTRLDLFTSQSVVTDIFNSLVPWNSVLWEFLVLIAVWIVQAIFLLQTDADTETLQYVVVVISILPWLCYLVYYAVRGASRRQEGSLQKRDDVVVVRETTNSSIGAGILSGGEFYGDGAYANDGGGAYASLDNGDGNNAYSDDGDTNSNTPTLLYMDWGPDGRARVCPPYNYKKLWLGIGIGFMGILLFRIHSLRHTLYNVVHPAWHVCVAVGGYYILCASLTRGLTYYVKAGIQREWLSAVGAPQGYRASSAEAPLLPPPSAALVEGIYDEGEYDSDTGLRRRNPGGDPSPVELIESSFRARRTQF